jgi:hypothetical protein
MTLFDSRSKDQVEVRGIDVAVGDDRAPRQYGK